MKTSNPDPVKVTEDILRAVGNMAVSAGSKTLDPEVEYKTTKEIMSLVAGGVLSINFTVVHETEGREKAIAWLSEVFKHATAHIRKDTRESVTLSVIVND